MVSQKNDSSLLQLLTVRGSALEVCEADTFIATLNCQKRHSFHERNHSYFPFSQCASGLGHQDHHSSGRRKEDEQQPLGRGRRKESVSVHRRRGEVKKPWLLAGAECPTPSHRPPITLRIVTGCSFFSLCFGSEM